MAAPAGDLGRLPTTAQAVRPIGVVTAYVYADHAGARILETMYRAARPGGLGEQVGTLAGAGGGSWPPRAGSAVITSAALLSSGRASPHRGGQPVGDGVAG